MCTDLPPSSPQTRGEQTDVSESADWYNSTYNIAWGSNVPQTRTPDAHFFTEVRYKGAKTLAITPDYSEVAKLADIWLHPKQGTDAALAMAMGHVALNEFYFKQRSPYFDDYARRYTDLPLLVMLEEHTLPDGSKTLVPDRYLRASDFNGQLGQKNNPEWKTVAFDTSGRAVLPNGSIGFRWTPEGGVDQGKWNLENKEARHGTEVKLKLSVIEDGPQLEPVRRLFHDAQFSSDGAGFPCIDGLYGGRRLKLEVIPDTMTVKRLPQLWLSVTALKPTNVNNAGFAVLIRPSGNDYYSLTQHMTVQLAPPREFPWECLVHGQSEASNATLRAVRTVAGAVLSDTKVKEIAVTQRGIRIVYQLAEGKRGQHLILRQTDFEGAALEPQLLAHLARELDALAAVLGIDLMEKNS